MGRGPWGGVCLAVDSHPLPCLSPCCVSLERNEDNQEYCDMVTRLGKQNLYPNPKQVLIQKEKRRGKTLSGTRCPGLDLSLYPSTWGQGLD